MAFGILKNIIFENKYYIYIVFRNEQFQHEIAADNIKKMNGEIIDFKIL
jgi:hypothetical protein